MSEREQQLAAHLLEQFQVVAQRAPEEPDSYVDAAIAAGYVTQDDADWVRSHYLSTPDPTPEELPEPPYPAVELRFTATEIRVRALSYAEHRIMRARSDSGSPSTRVFPCTYRVRAPRSRRRAGRSRARAPAARLDDPDEPPALTVKDAVDLVDEAFLLLEKLDLALAELDADDVNSARVELLELRDNIMQTQFGPPT